MIMISIVALNMLGILLMAYDKFAAIKDMQRVPEKTLLYTAVLGAFGIGFSMLAFRHKIRKLKFTITVPIFILLDSAFIYYIITTGKY